MHEARMLADIRQRLVDVASEQQASRILEATVWLGRLAHLDEATLRSNWPEVVRGTAAEGCQLHVQRSEDPTDPRALGVVLSEVQIEDLPPNPPHAAEPRLR